MDPAPDPADLGASMAGSMPDVTGGATAPATPPPAAAPSSPAPSPAPPSSEVDGKGRPFDAAKFLPKKDRHGNWIPKSPGRYGGKNPPAQTTTAAPSRPGEPDLFSSSSAAGSSSSSRASSPSPGAASYIPPESELPPPPKPGAGDPPPAPEPEAGADDVAEVGCFLLYGVTGFMTGAPDESEPPPKEHTRLKAVCAAYLESKGIKSRGGWAVVLGWVGYFLRVFTKPKSRAWAEERMGRRRPEPRRAEPVVDIAPAPSAPPPSPAPPAASAPGVPSYPVNLARR